jgi:hypothetical protein
MGVHFLDETNSVARLSLLQHCRIPTRMLDFMVDPLEAAFFAVESLDDVERRLFEVAVPKEAHFVTAVEVSSFAIGSMTQGELRVWEPRLAVSPHLAAQRGVFAVGRLPSRSRSRHAFTQRLQRERLITRSAVVSVASIPLYFVSPPVARIDG